MNNAKNNSNLPLVIIGLVLVAAIGGGWWLYSSSNAKTPKKTTNTNSANNKPVDDEALRQRYESVAVKSPGAQPSNVLGSPNAAVTIEEFADYQCPTCATVHPKMQEINKLYGGRIKFIYRSYPLTQIHKNSYDAALAAEAAGQQGKFWAMQDQLFDNQQTWSNSNEARKIFEEYAQKIGLDVAKFKADMIALPTKTRVDADLERGRALNIKGTPTVYINGLELPVEQVEVTTMRQIIDSELQKSSNQTQSSQTTTVNPTNQTGNAATNSK